MKALTLWCPWPYAIFHLPPHVAKRVENRSWKPPGRLIGERIAIHAGARWDRDGADFIARVTAHGARSEVYRMTGTSHHEGIIGTANLVGVIAWNANVGLVQVVHGFWRARLTRANVDDWWVGPYGWLLDDVRACAQPIPCRGRQGLWDVPPELVGRLP